MNTVNSSVRDGIEIIAISNPPVNALSHQVRSELVASVERAASNPDVAGIIILGEGRTFPAGADIREFGRPPKAPWLPEVCNRIEAVQKPILAAIHGTALGGGLEIAAACHFRIADSNAQVGFPEINLGLLPGAGGTQRATRLCGVQPALDLMLSGKPINSSKAAEIGLIDEVAWRDLLPEAESFLRSRVSRSEPVRRSRDAWKDSLSGVEAESALLNCRKSIAGKPHALPAQIRIVECVEAATKVNFFDGLAKERRLFSECLASPQSSALRHVFFAERKAAKFPGMESASVRTVREIGVIGGGTMGSAIAVACLQSGFRVVLVERDAEQLGRATRRIDAVLEAAVAKGFLPERKKSEMLASLEPATDFRSVIDSDIVVEAVFEDFSVKHRLFAALEAVAKPDAILASNTSYLDINELGGSLDHPERFLGLHFFAPANRMRLLEVVVGDRTNPDTVATSLAFAKKLGKIPVRSGVCEGFIGNRILTAYREACDLMLLDGATPFQIDGAMRGFGMKMGPYETMDLSGLDISWSRRKRLKLARDSRLRYCGLADKLCERGRFGRKTGMGFYVYGENGESRPDEDVTSLLEEIRVETGCSGRSFGNEEIRNRAIAAKVNEAAKIIDEGIASRPSDVDVVEIHGYGFPRWLGGPMKCADEMGLGLLLANIGEYAKTDALFWEPSTLLSKLAIDGSSFDDLN
ncbi:MAG: 3-hydroxyacyl-CoA dehydrogenase NAD-binding domain-containing protein [Albidovulum sp.]|nr:3-hydroxyacyl-CoA dehydrogenase NAD-binding domain-containing protein [Albidovulum sp.]